MPRTRPLLCGLVALGLAVSSSAGPQEVDIDFRLIAVTTPTGSETATTLPESIGTVCAGDTYYFELWVSDVGSINTGVSSAYVNLEWPGALATAVSIDHGTIFDELPSGTIGYGAVAEFGGSVLSSTGVAIEPEWVRVAVVELTANATGDATYTLQPCATGVAALGRGIIPWSDVSLDAVTLTTNWCGNALLSCTPLAQAGSGGGTITVEIFVEGVTGMNAYQVEVDPVLTSGTGTLTLNECFVDSEHGNDDFAFYGLDHFASCDPTNLRLAAVATESQTVDVPGGWPAYVGTYVFDVSGDAMEGSTFEVSILSEPGSLLLDPLSQTLPFDTAEACATNVFDCGTLEGLAEGCRYLQVTLNSSDQPHLEAIRVTSPDCPELLRYVDADGCLVTENPTFQTPAEWGTVHITGDDIVPSFLYEVTALCEDVETEAGTILASTWLWGDVNDDAIVNVIDIQKVVQCAEGTFYGGTTIYNTDLITQCGSSECDVFDVLAILDAFRSLPYSGGSPCGMASSPPGGGELELAPRNIGPVITLEPVSPSVWAGSQLTVEAFVQNVTDLRAYQIQSSIDGGAQGELACDALFVDTNRPDYVFYDAQSEDWPWVNTELCRLSSSLTEGGVDVGDEPKYLGTTVLASSANSCGLFIASLDVAHSFLLDHAGLPVEFTTDVVELTVLAPADYDGDCDVDLFDYTEFQSCFTGPDHEMWPECGVFDFDGDDDIDLADGGAFQAAFTGSLP